MINAERLRQMLNYDPAKGEFRWRPGKSGATTKRPAGTLHSKRRQWTIMIDRKHYLAHRLAWLWVHGTWPPHQIDHINGDPADNRLSNLRLATQTQNNANTRRPRHNTSGLKGASWNSARQKWAAVIAKDRKRYHLGFFDSPQSAHTAYADAARKLYGEFARLS